MRLTPLEIRQHKFATSLRGFDRVEVDAFLDTVVSDFEDVVRENAQLRREAERLVRELDAYRAREKTIQDTLTTAQAVVEQLKRTAIKESESLVVDAELRAEKIVSEARERRDQLAHDIREQRHLRQRLGEDLRRTLDGYARLIEAFADAEEIGVEAKTDP
jgi:cell division initiation protein